MRLTVLTNFTVLALASSDKNQFWISWKTPEAKQVYNGTQAVQTNLMRSLMHIKSPFIWYWSMAKEITSSNSILYFRLCEAQVEIELRVSLRSCG